jgi:hypothetical protein
MVDPRVQSLLVQVGVAEGAVTGEDAAVGGAQQVAVGAEASEHARHVLEQRDGRVEHGLGRRRREIQLGEARERMYRRHGHLELSAEERQGDGELDRAFTLGSVDEEQVERQPPAPIEEAASTRGLVELDPAGKAAPRSPDAALDGRVGHAKLRPD